MTCNSSVWCSLWLCRAAKLAYKIEKSSEFPDFKITEYFVLETSRNICNIAPSVKLWGLPAVDRMLAPFAKIRIGNQIRNTMSATFFQWCEGFVSLYFLLRKVKESFRVKQTRFELSENRVCVTSLSKGTFGQIWPKTARGGDTTRFERSENRVPLS